MYSPLWKITHQSLSVLCTPPFENTPHQSPSVSCTPPFENTPHQIPSVLCTPPFEKSPIKAHRFCVLPPLKTHPSNPIGFVYSPLWKITHQNPSVSCTPPFEKWLFLVGANFGKYGIFIFVLKMCQSTPTTPMELLAVWTLWQNEFVEKLTVDLDITQRSIAKSKENIR